MAKRKKADCFSFIQEMEGCDVGEELNMDGSDSDETVETHAGKQLIVEVCM